MLRALEEAAASGVGFTVAQAAAAARGGALGPATQGAIAAARCEGWDEAAALVAALGARR